MKNNKCYNIVPSLGLSVNNCCDMQCVYCPPNGENIDSTKCLCEIESMIHLIEIAKVKGFRVVRLTGGEPLLSPDRTHSLIARAVELGFEKVILNTNGSKLETNINWLSEYSKGFECKVSLDTLDRETFKQITGTDNLNAVLSGIEKASNCGLNITVNIVVTRLNYTHVPEILLFCESNGFGAKIFDMYNFTGIFQERWQNYYYPINELIAYLENKFQKLNQERLPGGRGLAMKAFRFKGGKKLLVVNHHGKETGSRLFSQICLKCHNYPCACGRFQLALRSDGILTTCRLRPDLGFYISIADYTMISRYVTKLLDQFENCIYCS